jgi:hypothetical protein
VSSLVIFDPLLPNVQDSDPKNAAALWTPWPIEIDDPHDDLPITHGDFPVRKLSFITRG